MTKQGHLFFISLLLVIWVLMLIVTNPIGNFPLNDDWTYGASVKATMAAGSFKLPDSSAAAIFTQVMWGILFCKAFGFSYTVLRFSTIALGLTGTIALYLLAFDITQNKRTSFFAALLLLVNPLYFSLANTFMTDVPFLTLIIISCLLFYKSFSKGNAKYVILGTVFSIAATLVRQVGLVLPIAYAFAVLLTQKSSYKLWGRIVIPPLLVNAVLFLFMQWMKQANPQFQTYQGSESIFIFLKDVPGFAYRIFMRTGDMFYNSGFFLLPLLIFTVPRAFIALSARQKKMVVICTVVFIPSIIRAWPTLPTGNILNLDSLGPRLLRDTYVLLIHVYPVSNGLLCFLLCLGLLGAVLLVAGCAIVLMNTIRGVKQRNYSAQFSGTVFFSFFLLGYCFLTYIIFNFFDRYTLPALIMFLLIILRVVPDLSAKGTIATISTLVAFTALFSSLATHDYLAWNRARWQGLNYLTQNMNIRPERIDGGYEFNGLMLGSSYPTHPGKSWWYVCDDEFMVSFGPVDGYNTIKQFNYCNYLPFKEESISVLQRK